MTLKIPFGLRDGRLFEPLQVERGLACICVCPGCGAALVAKHAPAGRVHPHFAHADAADCTNGGESAVHLAAKQLIEGRKQVFMPPLAVHAMLNLSWGERLERSAAVVKAALLDLDHVDVEKAIDDIKPDLIARSGDLRVLIEIGVTHFVDAQKLAKIRSLDLPTIEIDLSGFEVVNFESLSRVLFEASECAYWVHHPDREPVRKRLLAQLADAKESEERRRQEKADQAAADKLYRESLALVRHADERSKHEDFKALSSRQKLAKALAVLRLPGDRIPAFLDVPARAYQSILAPRTAWQAASFAMLVHHAGQRQLTRLNAESVVRWLEMRFDIDRAAGKPEVAAWDFLEALRGMQILNRQRGRDFVVMASGVEAAIQLYEEARAPGRRPQRWATTWPDAAKARIVAAAFADQFGNGALWERVSGLLPSVRDLESPTETSLHYVGEANAELLRRFLLSAGFTVLGDDSIASVLVRNWCESAPPTQL